MLRLSAKDMQIMQEKIYKPIGNQIDTLTILKGKLLLLCKTNGFSGKTADVLKAYITEIHMPIIEAFMSALMDIEIKLRLYINDFSNSVDTSGFAIVEDDYLYKIADIGIQDFIDDCNLYKTESQTTMNNLSGIVSTPNLNFAGIISELEDLQNETRKLIKQMDRLEYNHANDLKSINDIFFPAIKNGLSYMGNLKRGGKNYSSGDMKNQDWFNLLEGYNVDVFRYASKNDPDFWNSIYGAAMADTDVMILDVLLDGSDIIASYTPSGVTLSEGVVEGIQLINSKLKFSVTEDVNGVIRLVVDTKGVTLTNSQIASELQKAGINREVISSKTINRLFGKGLVIKPGTNAALYSSDIIKNVPSDLKALSVLQNEIFGLTKSETKALPAGMKALRFFDKVNKFTGPIGKAAPIIGGFITTSSDICDAAYDPRTKSYSYNVKASDIVASAAVNTGYNVLSTMGITKAAGFVVGAVAASPTGPAAIVGGAVLGAAADILITHQLYNVKRGNTQEPLIEKVKKSLSTEIENAVNFLVQKLA
jgi:hypothetical protein